MPSWVLICFKYLLYPAALSYRYSYRAYCFITGKSSGSFAWLLCALNASFTLTRDYVHHFFWMLPLIHTGFIAFRIWITREYNRYMRMIPEDTIIVMFIWTPILTGITAGSMFCVYLFAIPAPGLAIQCFLDALWCISVTVYRPGGKSIFSKAKAKLKEMAANRKPVLAPMPA